MVKILNYKSTGLLASLSIILFSMTIKGEGSYSSTTPSNIRLPSTPYITPNLRGPVLTTDWCASLVFDSVSNNMFAHPLAFKCENDGIWIGYPNQGNSTENSYSFPFNRDVKISISGLSGQRALLDSYGDWSATASWRNGDLKATMGHGLPYVYFTSESGASVEITGNPQIWYNKNGSAGLTTGTRHYALYAPSGSDWLVNGNILSSSLDGKKYFSIAALPDTTVTTFEYFRRFAYNFVTDTKVTWTYNREQSTVTANYRAYFEAKEGAETALLYALYPHQWQNCFMPFTAYTYNSVRGPMKVIEDESFTTTTPFTGILPSLPLIAQKSSRFSIQTLRSYINSEESKTADQLIRSNADTYWTGKDLGRTSELVKIAEQAGDTIARDHFLSAIKSKLEDWFTYTKGESSEYFFYESTWGTLIGVNASYGSDEHINDHHFHYGYFVMAASTVAQYDPAWALRWKEMVDMVIRDCNSPYRDDVMFPFMRAFDIYAGHSWASGDAAFASGNNQESTSEAINFAAGTALWGIATQDTLIRDLGIFLYTTETASLVNYWLDRNNICFPSDFNHSMVGIIWGDKADYATWFSSEPECIHGINMLPFTAASLYLGSDDDYVMRNYTEIISNNGGPVNDWLDIMWEFLAFGDPDSAVAALENNADYTPEDGESKAHTYHWIHNLFAAGKIRHDITANIPCYAVFDSSGKDIYVMYNESDTTLLAVFSDGVSFSVPPRSLIYANKSQGTGIISHKKTGDTPVCRISKIGPNLEGTIKVTESDVPRVSLYDISGRSFKCSVKADGNGQYRFTIASDVRIKSGLAVLSVGWNKKTRRFPFIIVR